ncbi:uncharacterized protein LOC143298371 isoform X2 [Babylonia areolata]|uniref:uncharacterized protein LOC143298371 isoform X2 n=1 Tax=Babylonia areolata TaxID=304850 RepID=UPI003FD63D26
MSVPLQRKFGGYNCGYKCPSPSTPLVDALAIDFFNGNYCPRPRKSRGTRGSDHEAYMNYLRLSCEDVDCMECRAYRLGLDFHGGVASCPSLQLKLAQDLAVPLGRLHGVGTALDNNYNSQPGCGHFQRDCDGGVASTAEDSSVTATTNDNTCSHSSNATKTSPPPPGVFSREAGSAVHRRLDFRKGAISGNTTTDSLTSCASTSMDSTNSNSNSDYHHHQHPLSRSAAPPTREQTDNRISSSSPSSQQQCSPAGFRRLSFLAAVDKSKKTDADWNRRPSYRAAVEPGYLPGGDPSDNDQLPSCHVDGRGENKMVTFQLGGGENGAGGGGGGGGHALSLSSSSFSSSTDSDGPFWGHCAASGALRGPNSQPRKLSILLEEEDADDSQKTPEKRSSLSSVSRSPTPTPHHFDFNSNAEIHESDPLDAPNESSDGQRSGAHSSLHGSPQGGSPRITADVKVILPATEGNNRPDMMMAGQPAACNADNMPAHFKHRSELPTITSQPPPPSSSSSSTSAADTSTTLTTAAATTTPYSTVTASNVSTLAPQPLILVPGSPPHTPPQTPRVAHDGTQPAAVPSRLAKLRQNNLAKKREQMKTMKMPELSEHAESSSDTEQQQPPPSVGNGGATLPSSSSPKTPLVSARSGDNDDSCRMDSNSSGGGGGGGVEVVRPPSPSKDPVTPSIPESFLKKLGLSAADKNVVNGETSVDQLPDKQLESRFNSLALAFKTDRLTLDQRLGIQERSRDIAEQNIDKELQGLRDAVEILNQLCADERVQEVISKIQHHLDILEHSVARVSSRAEVFGAVQQEKRMCLAMEVMITYTENIRRLRSTEQSDVEEARRILSSSRQNFSLDTLSIGDRRSASVCAALSNPRTARRRSEVALPRFFGGAGSPSLHVTSSMEPRQRFQSATANVTVRNVVTNTLRRASMDRQKNLSLHSTSSLSSSNQSSSRNNSLDKSQDKEQETKQHSQEEEAYRHGYEEGLKASLSRELTDLRDQQATISSSLDQVMDRVESFQDDDKDDSDIDEAVSKVKDAVVKVRLWMSNPNWQSASQTLRKVAAGLFFLLAMLVVVVTFAPLIPAHISLRNHAKSAQ